MHRWLAQVLVIGTVTGGVVLGAALPASAHANLVRSDPADGAVLTQAPSTLRLSFDESVQVGTTRVQISDRDGRAFVPTSVRLTRSTSAGQNLTEAPVDVVVSLPPLGPNTYRIAWRTLSSDDLHATKGTLVFGVQRNVTAAGKPAAEPPPSAAESVLRWIGLVGLAALVGGLVLGGWLVPGSTASAGRLRRRLYALAIVGGAAGVLADTARLVVQAAARPGGPLGGTIRLLADTTYGPRWLAWLAAALVLTTVAVLLRRRSVRLGPDRPDRQLAAAAIAASLVLAVASATLGHLAANGPLTLAVGALHVLAALLWTGALVATGVVLLPLLRQPDAAEVARTALRRFAVVAVSCVGVLAVTGLLLAGTLVSTVDAGLVTLYGRTLLVKVLLVAVAALLGLVNHRRLRRRADGALPRRTLAAEGLALAAVVGLAGLLASSSPARGPQWTPPTAQRPSLIQSGQAADLTESLTVRPNRPGQNFVSVGVFDTRRPAPAPIGSVMLDLRGPDGRSVAPSQANPVGDREYTLATNLDKPGTWRVSVTVLRLNLPPATTAYAWVVGGVGSTTPIQPLVVSRARLAPTLDWLAALLALGLLTALALAFVRWRYGITLRVWSRTLRPSSRVPATREEEPRGEGLPERGLDGLRADQAGSDPRGDRRRARVG